MVNWKSKYLEMKLKYINTKHKGGMVNNTLPLEEDIERIYQKAIFENHVHLINDFLELTWYESIAQHEEVGHCPKTAFARRFGWGYNDNKWGELTETIEEIDEKISSWYNAQLDGQGYSLNISKIKENSDKLDFNLLEDVVERMKDIAAPPEAGELGGAPMTQWV